MMNNIPAQEIKRRGISGVDDAPREGPVHVIKNNRPQYVVITEARFQELLEAEQSAAINGIRASLEDVKAGGVTRYEDADTLMQSLERDED